MGIWSHEPFSNDAACDLVFELVADDDLLCIEVALDRFLTGSDDCSEIYSACAAIAAVELLAILVGKGTDAENIPEVFHLWVKEHHQVPSADLIKKAKVAAHRIYLPSSGLMEFWSGTDGGDNWMSCTQKLISVFDS